VILPFMSRPINPERDALVAAVTVLLITALCISVVTWVARMGLVESVQQEILPLARTASAFTDGDLHETLTDQGQKGGDVYSRVQAPYRQILAANSQLRYVYTCILKNDKVYFVIDTQPVANHVAEGERDTTANIMEEYPDASPAMMRALSGQVAVAENNVYSDEWGTFLSAYVPIYNSSHKFIGIVGVDIDATSFNARIMRGWIACAFGMFLSLLLSMVVYRLVLSIRKGHAVEERERNRRLHLMQGFYGHVADISGSIGSVATRISGMADDIRQMALDGAQLTIQARTTIRGSTGRIQAMSFVCDELVTKAGEMQQESGTACRLLSGATGTLQASGEASGNLAAASENISGILSMIVGITRKTDVLAMNALIEAARAGESGKGFAVVADEVKTLSRQIGQATGTINDYIASMRGAVETITTTIVNMSDNTALLAKQSANTASIAESQKELVSQIAGDVDSVTGDAAAVEDTVKSVADLAAETEIYTGKIYSSLRELTNRAKEINQTVKAFMNEMEAGGEDRPVAARAARKR